MNNLVVVKTDSDLFEIDLFTFEEYQLLYGLLYHTQRAYYAEEKLYNLAASLCNEYIEYPLLMNLKIGVWGNLLKGLKTRVLQLQKDNNQKGLITRYCFPFFGGGGARSDELIQSIEVLESAIKTIGDSHPTTPLPIYNPDKFTYPLKEKAGLFIDFAESWRNRIVKAKEGWERAQNNGFTEERLMEISGRRPLWKRYEDIYGGILWEMRRTIPSVAYFQKLEEEGINIDSLCTPENEWLYQEYFLQQRGEAERETILDENELENIKELSTKKRTGVLLYMLESFGVRDKERARKLIHFALYHGSKPFRVKVDGNDTVYSYLHSEKQLFKLAGEIKAVLKEYDVPIPDGLERLDTILFK